jgi:hypothetical protein
MERGAVFKPFGSARFQPHQRTGKQLHADRTHNHAVSGLKIPPGNTRAGHCQNTGSQ